MAWVVRQITVGPGEAARLDVLVCRVTERSRSEARAMVAENCVRIDGLPCDETGRIVQPGERIDVRFDAHRRYREKPQARPTAGFRILHEDADLVVVEKEARLLTVPTDRAKGGSLVDLVAAELRRTGHRGAAHIVHRLDRGVSGLLALAKTPPTAGRLQALIRARAIDREYLAIVAGRLLDSSGRFESRLATDRALNRRIADEDEDYAEIAITNFHVERRMRDASLVRIRLETGRRHQIRCHFADAGHPVLGDERYRPDLAAHPGWPFSRLALHAARLGFAHPVTGETLNFESPLPSEFVRFLDRNV